MSLPPTTDSLFDDDSVEAELASFIEKFEPEIADLIRQCRAEVRKLLPTAVEIVYDNYNFFVIGYASTERASDCIVSITAASNGVGLSFYYGASLPDPSHLFNSSLEGNTRRAIDIHDGEKVDARAFKALVKAAVAHNAKRVKKR